MTFHYILFNYEFEDLKIYCQVRGDDNIFKRKIITQNCVYFVCLYSTEAAPSLWDVEFAKQLAAVTEQPFENGFEEMIQWTKEGKLWEFPINNEAGKS